MKLKESYIPTNEIEDRCCVELNIRRILEEYGYSWAPSELEKQAIQLYKDKMPKRFVDMLKIEKNSKDLYIPLFTIEGTQICGAFSGFYIDDKHSCIETYPNMLCIDNLMRLDGQPHKRSDFYDSDIRWWTVKDNSKIKILHTKMDYGASAGWHPGYYYISVYDVFPLEAFEI